MTMGYRKPALGPKGQMMTVSDNQNISFNDNFVVFTLSLRPQLQFYLNRVGTGIQNKVDACLVKGRDFTLHH